MKITIISVGKIKENYYMKAIEEYSKRLSRYCNLEIIEVIDEKTPDKASQGEVKQIKEKEAIRIMKHIKPDNYIIALAIEGHQLDSPQLAEKIEHLGLNSISHIVFIIGGSLGLDEQVLKKADELLSFSKMTFPHQLMRVILLEQIYRSYRIIKKEPYHK
ncbi:23S rRNA (pseudouridine(1915)-N(3))-methyltransferase RlmH [Anaerosacchariphilus polymeriproducens]|uniref:Ribosomal RNA large subunit methyltransferase H n=1 Tax=Anaerosacchariphilus polymeriproducens TaxID=1812858 RepID=A0A371AU60_9FIRM|nr:23S rRNA (pseudouridine(1915)-N(3))-methyltransferase RlmH [Anaerosacchariphilus polymeriproducens]RDU23082.1 23S rRNA (pseudouridine(1915)-N(3))-methyltransferase RlmH [Anaerosacchariphilus polymeriproducens]